MIRISRAYLAPFVGPVVAPFVALSLIGAPVHAQQDDGLSLMEKGAKLFLKGMMDEMAPALDEMETFMRDAEPLMRGFVTEMGPALKDLLEEVEDWSVYHPPEILPNGDIIIRRKTARAPESDGTPEGQGRDPEPGAEPGSEIEL